MWRRIYRREHDIVLQLREADAAAIDSERWTARRVDASHLHLDGLPRQEEFTGGRMKALAVKEYHGAGYICLECDLSMYLTVVPIDYSTPPPWPRVGSSPATTASSAPPAAAPPAAGLWSCEGSCLPPASAGGIRPGTTRSRLQPGFSIRGFSRGA